MPLCFQKGGTHSGVSPHSGGGGSGGGGGGDGGGSSPGLWRPATAAIVV